MPPEQTGQEGASSEGTVSEGTSSEPAAEDTEPAEALETAEPAALAGPPVIPAGENCGFTDFDTALIAFLEENGWGRENLLVSPLSLRAALALAVSGAAGDTETALLTAMGFASAGEAAEWYDRVMQGVASFESRLQREREWYAQYPADFGNVEPDRAYRIANSIWNNADGAGTFRPEFVEAAEQRFGAAAASLPGAELAEAVNAWVNERTEGMIPALAEDLSETEAVLVNVLYLRSVWNKTFSADNTLPMTFTTAEGEGVEKDFMSQQDSFGYYADEDTALVVLPMQGSISAAFVLGDTSDISEKLSQAERCEVLVTIPKIELECSLSDGELTGFLAERGAGIALSEDADFSGMSETPWFIRDILQKSRLRMDEDGLEAAAATAVLMDNALVMEPETVQEFTADRPFALYVYSTYGEQPELLFFGQYLY